MSGVPLTTNPPFGYIKNPDNGLIQKLYEDTAIGKISDERYATLSMSYVEEQRAFKVALPDIENYLETETDKFESLQRFIDKVKRITEIKELNLSWYTLQDTLTAREFKS